MPNYLSDSFSVLLISAMPIHRTVQRRSNAICALKCKHCGLILIQCVKQQNKNELFERIQTLPSATSCVMFNLETDKLAINRVHCVERELSLLPRTQTPDNSTI